MCKIEPNCLPFEIIDKFLKSISFHLLLNSCAKEQYLVIKNSFSRFQRDSETLQQRKSNAHNSVHESIM